MITLLSIVLALIVLGGIGFHSMNKIDNTIKNGNTLQKIFLFILFIVFIVWASNLTN